MMDLSEPAAKINLASKHWCFFGPPGLTARASRPCIALIIKEIPTLRNLILIISALLVFSACSSDSKTESADQAVADSAQNPCTAPAVEPATNENDGSPRRLEVQKVLPRPSTGGGGPKMMAASHVLVTFKGARGAKEEITLSKEAALAKAIKLTKEIEAGASFEDIAKKNSDGPTKDRGGSLGTFRPNRMVPEFSGAVVELEEGKVTTEPVESPFGYHIIRRDKAEYYGAKHVLIQYVGAPRANEKVTRTIEEADKFAREILARAQKGETFEQLAIDHSDGPTAKRGGNLDVFPKGAMVPPFEAALEEVKPKELVPHVVETQFGYHVIYRTD